MKNKCTICGSYAINYHLYDRNNAYDLDLCDVHYWMKRAKAVRSNLRTLAAYINDQAIDCEMCLLFIDDTCIKNEGTQCLEAIIDYAIENPTE